MFETAHLLLSFALSTGSPQLDQIGFEDDEYIVIQDDGTGSVPLDDWSPATGETILVEDHVRDLAHDAIRFTDALSEFGVDPQADEVAEAFMRRTAPANVPKRRLTRK